MTAFGNQMKIVLLLSCASACRSFVLPSTVVRGKGPFALSEPPRCKTNIFAGNEQDSSSIFERFTNPKLDDPYLPLTEAGIAQIIAPSLELFWLVSIESPYPSWARPISDAVFAARGAFLAPTLIHGAGLACCWLAGCLAVKGYQREVYNADFGSVFWSTAKAGAFATGLLVIATQLDLYTEFGGYVQMGDSAEADARIAIATIEVVNDVFFEGVTLLVWRLFRSTVQ